MFIEYDYDYDYSYGGLDVLFVEYQDVYECVYVNDICCCFVNCEVIMGQIIVFGLMGGLILCLVLIIVLLLCL